MKGKKATKRALLSSALSLVLCFSMLLGTTFAWFTDEAKTGVNTIQAGTLDIMLMGDYDGDGEYTNDLQDESFPFKSIDINVGADILWEPGVTFLTDGFQIQNHGDLWLKYQMVINGVTDGDAKLLEAIDFYMTTVAPDDYSTGDAYMTAVKAGESSAETFGLNDFVSKFRVLAPKDETGEIDGTTYDDYDGTYYLVGHMKEEANNDYQGLSIEGVGITVYATQMEAESDSFDNKYDDLAAVTVGSEGADYTSLAAAIAALKDGGTVFVEPGTYTIGSVITISGKTLSIIGMGNVELEYAATGGSHFFNVTTGSNVTFENLTMTNAAKHGIYVRNNSVATLKNVSISGSRGSADIMVDEASDATHGKTTASYVNLVNSDVERVALCASPVTSVAATQDTYVYFNYDRNSTVGAIEVQDINLKPENIFINNVASTDVGKTMNLYVSNDEELAAALETIKTNSEYWNKQVYVYMAAGEYSADHVINQYPQWNGVVGAGATANNYASGVPAGAPGANVTFVGETASTYSLRSVATPAVVFTGNVTVNGFGNAGTGFGTATAVTTFQNIAFDAANSIEANGEDYVVLYLKAAANGVNFEGCTFENATHITLGGSAADAVGAVYFDGCTFNDGGCLSGYVETLNVSDSTVTAAKNGFINKSKAGAVTVTGLTANVSRYFIRTANSGVKLTVKDSDITVYESEGTKHLVYFRGSNESAEFINCTITDGWTTAGVDANSTLEVYNFSETADGLTLVTDGITDEVTLYLVPADYEGTTVNVPEGVDTIGGYAFAYNSNIETIKLPSTVTTLNDRAFRDTSASTVILNEGLTNISYQAFRNASNVTSVEIPSTVTTISKEAFQNSGITTLTIPANVKTIEYGGCRDMKMLEHVVIEGNVEIPVYAFRACTNLKTVTLKGDNVTFAGRGMIFTNKENGDGSAITVTVHNEAIKARLLAADTAATDYGGYTIVCENTPNGDGVYDDGNGNTYAYASDNTDLSTAISGGADTVYLNSGTYVVPSATSGQTVTITGNGETVIDITTVPTYAGLPGATITFENLTIKSDQQGAGYDRGFAHTNKITYNNCVIDGTLGLNTDTEFNNCTFNISGNYYNLWTWGAENVALNGCTFNSDGKAVLLYGGANTKLTVDGCTFNDNGGLTSKKAAIEIGNDYGTSYELIVNNTVVNGYEINDEGISTGTTLWANKNSMGTDKLNVVVNGVDVY